MFVVKYKRAKDGLVICFMLSELYKFMLIYVRYIRFYFVKLDEEALFVINEGVVFREGIIGRRFIFFVEKCGVNLVGRMVFVDMRKVIITEMLKRVILEEREIFRRVFVYSERIFR